MGFFLGLRREEGSMDATEFKNKIAAIYGAANELGEAFGIKTCTPDGHLLGAIGQIAAKIAFGLEFGSKIEEHNCTWSEGSKKKDIQARCSGRGNIVLRAEPDHLIALEISEKGAIRLIYNGPGHYVWKRIKDQKNSQKIASSKLLLEIQNRVNQSEKLSIKENLFDP